mmetsp:Transcript_10426/g.28479  ORF Transcript_10426/g.28479 Transcript_10426/m.28479 type:complete len:220 (+) Transcript_10426:115-774(+)|eukprot:CAMPEP_0202355384 /NCGR_PEP_ID=MMETSP1126-20121109/10304_1 /ASSEMBLY_ACC=CAM_ASM_000457 /TAXON_ID=3047 /ORGANISM="Dunaliella tertiolecta, Strain CCMP1320" /LENGTH=219 /DNA_ID=CAMNT_0048947997 /DNA_START=104 /DNA_END=763 /DNA_ORIENTATION=-
MASNSKADAKTDSFPIRSDVESLPDESQKRRAPFTIYDVFFWRDAPDWYHKTFLCAGFGLCYYGMRQYLSRHELEVFLPPRAQVLPKEMREGYAQTQRFKYGLLKVGKETTLVAGTAGIYYGGAYYLGKYRGFHDWTNFTASGGVAGTALALYTIRPPRLRTTVFGSVLGLVVGTVSGYGMKALGIPYFDESHGFEGWWLGEYINEKAANANKAEKEVA